MEIDLFTLAAQVVNFLLLAWLLKTFLFDRVTAVMDERVKRTNAALAMAEAARERSEKESASVEALRAEIESGRTSILAEARMEALEGRRRALAEARSAGEAETRSWRRDLAARKRAFLGDLGRQTGTWLGHLARKVLADLADEDLEVRIVAVFLSRLASLGDDQVAKLRASLDSGKSMLIVTSGFAIGKEDRERIAEAALAKLGVSGDIAYILDEDLGVGISMLAGGFTLAWGIEEYLAEIDARILAAFDREGANQEGQDNVTTAAEVSHG